MNIVAKYKKNYSIVPLLLLLHQQSAKQTLDAGNYVKQLRLVSEKNAKWGLLAVY